MPLLVFRNLSDITEELVMLRLFWSCVAGLPRAPVYIGGVGGLELGLGFVRGKGVSE